MANIKKYFTEEDKKIANKEAQKRWYQKHKQTHYEKMKIWRQENKKHVNEKVKKWREDNPKLWRACFLVRNYKKEDNKYNRGECTLTAQWIVDNIFPKPCHYCGEEEWEIMGCDRINNYLPHTPENVVPCCKECNIKRQKKSYEEFKKEMGLEF